MGFCLTPRSVRDSQHRPVDDGRRSRFFEKDRRLVDTLAKTPEQELVDTLKLVTLYVLFQY